MPKPFSVVPPILPIQISVATEDLQHIVATTPDTEREERCVWCWLSRYPGRPYPFRSACLCHACAAFALAGFRQRRAARLAAIHHGEEAMV